MSGWYTDALQKIGAKAIDLSADALEIWPIRTSGGGAGPYYTPNLATDTTLAASVPNNADCRPMTGQALDSVTWTGAVLDAANEVFTAMPAGDAVQGWLLVHVATGQLLVWQDTGPGLPFTPADVDVTYQPNASGIADIIDAP